MKSALQFYKDILERHEKIYQGMILHQNQELSCQTVRPPAVQIPKIIHPLNVLSLLQFQG